MGNSRKIVKKGMYIQVYVDTNIGMTWFKHKTNKSNNRVKFKPTVFPNVSFTKYKHKLVIRGLINLLNSN